MSWMTRMDGKFDPAIKFTLEYSNVRSGISLLPRESQVYYNRTLDLRRQIEWGSVNISSSFSSGRVHRRNPFKVSLPSLPINQYVPRLFPNSNCFQRLNPPPLLFPQIGHVRVLSGMNLECQLAVQNVPRAENDRYYYYR